jgi:hypothetical protein
MASIEQRVLEGFRDELGESQHELEVIRSVQVVQGDPPLVILEEAQTRGEAWANNSSEIPKPKSQSPSQNPQIQSSSPTPNESGA